MKQSKSRPSLTIPFCGKPDCVFSPDPEKNCEYNWTSHVFASHCWQPYCNNTILFHLKPFHLDVANNHKKPAAVVPPTRHTAIALTWLVLAIALFIIYFLLKTGVLSFNESRNHLFTNLVLAAGTGAGVRSLSVFAQKIIVQRSHQPSQGYNLVQAIRLISVLIVIVIFVSFLFQNWYAAVASLGLISLILGFALQTPISSFIGWLYIIARSPYHINDRIQINSYKGDVVEIGYLDTTLWEFGGDYLTNDLPSGRLIRFPNSLVLQSAVYNYSWHRFPYIWNEIPLHIAYESDLLFVENTIREVTRKELDKDITDRVEELKQNFSRRPVPQLDIKEFPYVSFRTNANTWIEATVTYLVEPKQAAELRSRLLKKIIAGLLEQPDKVMFPKTNNR